MGNFIRFIFRTKYRYGKTDQFFILVGILGIIQWLLILIFLIFK
jgi:hypothetical protein